VPRSHELSVSGCDMRSSPTWQTVAIVASTSLGMRDGGCSGCCSSSESAPAGSYSSKSPGSQSRCALTHALRQTSGARGHGKISIGPLWGFYRRGWQRFALSVGSHLLGRLMGVFDTWLFAALVRQEAEVYWIRARKRKLAEPEEVDDLLGLTRSRSSKRFTRWGLAHRRRRSRT